MTADPSITCPKCGMTSHNPSDVKYGYCGMCHDFTGDPAPVEKPVSERPPVRHGPTPPPVPSTLNNVVRLLGILFVIAFFLGFFLVLTTDVWPYMHEVIWQHSWKPVCADPNGKLVFCQ